MSQKPSSEFGHYYRDVRHLERIDIYRFCDLFDIRGPLEHALKKIACAGLRGSKDFNKDLNEAIKSINRAIEMREEDEAAANQQS